MVRIGTLPTRLLALEYGANLVWGPEIVDKAIIGSERVVDGQSLSYLSSRIVSSGIVLEISLEMISIFRISQLTRSSSIIWHD